MSTPIESPPGGWGYAKCRTFTRQELEEHDEEVRRNVRVSSSDRMNDLRNLIIDWESDESTQILEDTSVVNIWHKAANQLREVLNS